MKLQRWQPPTAVTLAILWICVMFLYVYGDYFYMYVPGKLDAMGAGRLGPLRAYDEQTVAIISMLMVIPATMPAVSILLPSVLSKWLNVVFGFAYSGILALTMPGAALFYQIYGVIEIGLTLSIAVIALRWPRSAEE